MKILGFNAYIHDTAAALLVDGELAAFAEEERLIREKHTTRFPKKAIEFCLQQTGTTIDEIDAVAFYWDPGEGMLQRIGQTLLHFPGSLRPLVKQQLGNFRNMGTVEKRFRETYRFDGPFHFVSHYCAHAAHAGFGSPFATCAIMVVDGNGEIGTTWFGRLNEEGRLQKFHEILYPHSIGLVWCAITEYLGFTQNCDEGKVMGLSAYGTDRLVDEIRKIFVYDGGLDYRVDLSYFDYHKSRRRWFSPKFEAIFGPSRMRSGPILAHHYDVARALQTVTEEMLLALSKALLIESSEQDLAYTGGVALNCVANGRLLFESGARKLFIPPAAYDAGAAEGAARYVYHMLQGNNDRHPFTTAYLGPEYDDASIEQALQNAGLPYHRSDDPFAETAKHLAAGKIVGWYQGRLEAGPRALGNRSILADPRSPNMKAHVNDRVKHREGFRPFGPSVLKHRADEIFVTNGADSPHMLLAFDVRENWREKIPAVVHVDHTARIQTVEKSVNPRYTALLEAFENETTVPVVLNTSFNVMGQPIVDTPRDAVECFLSTGIDVLCIGDFICEKQQ